MTKSINERELVLGILLEVTRDGEHSQQRMASRYW